MNLKEEVYKHCLAIINNKISLLQLTLNDLRNSAANETKSTAGDKHETALAMLQIEQENTGRQLQEALQQKLHLERIQIELKTTNVVNGSLVKTDRGVLFICCAIGRLSVNEISIIAISPQSPLGSKLLGLQVNNTVEMNKIIYTIEEIN